MQVSAIPYRINHRARNHRYSWQTSTRTTQQQSQKCPRLNPRFFLDEDTSILPHRMHCLFLRYWENSVSISWNTSTLSYTNKTTSNELRHLVIMRNPHKYANILNMCLQSALIIFVARYVDSTTLTLSRSSFLYFTHNDVRDAKPSKMPVGKVEPSPDIVLKHCHARGRRSKREGGAWLWILAESIRRI